MSKTGTDRGYQAHFFLHTKNQNSYISISFTCNTDLVALDRLALRNVSGSFRNLPSLYRKYRPLQLNQNRTSIK